MTRGVATPRASRRGADVVVESFRPGVAERLGIGYETLSRASPSLVYSSITGFGPTGPLAGLKAYEGVVHAKAGRMDAFYTLVEKDGPIYPALAVASYGAAMASLHGTLVALMLRDRTGEGQKVETSLLQGLTCFDLWNFLNWQIHERTGEEVARGVLGPGAPLHDRAEQGRPVVPVRQLDGGHAAKLHERDGPRGGLLRSQVPEHARLRKPRRPAGAATAPARAHRGEDRG